MKRYNVKKPVALGGVQYLKAGEHTADELFANMLSAAIKNGYVEEIVDPVVEPIVAPVTPEPTKTKVVEPTKKKG